MNALEYIKQWCAQDQSALSGRQVADAVIRMCDDALQDLGRPTPVVADVPCSQCGNVGIINRNGTNQCDACGYPARG